MASDEFDRLVRTQCSGQTVRMAKLFQLAFKSGTRRFWTGEYPLASGGHTWSPTFGIGKTAGVRMGQAEAPEIRVPLATRDPLVQARLVASEAEWYFRPFSLFLQWFDADWQPLLDPQCIVWGDMKDIECRQRPLDDGLLYELDLIVEVKFDGRGRAPNGYLTAMDQKAEYPTDDMLNQISGIEAKLVTFPCA